MDEEAAQRNASQLDGLIEETSALSNQLKTRVKNLQKKGGSGRDGQIRKQQVRPATSQIFHMPRTDVFALISQTGLVKQKFVEAIQNYQQVEQQHRSKYKQRMERQFKIGE